MPRYSGFPYATMPPTRMAARAMHVSRQAKLAAHARTELCASHHIAQAEGGEQGDALVMPALHSLAQHPALHGSARSSTQERMLAVPPHGKSAFLLYTGRFVMICA